MLKCLQIHDPTVTILLSQVSSRIYSTGFRFFWWQPNSVYGQLENEHDLIIVFGSFILWVVTTVHHYVTEVDQTGVFPLFDPWTPYVPYSPRRFITLIPLSRLFLCINSIKVKLGNLTAKCVINVDIGLTKLQFRHC